LLALLYGWMSCPLSLIFEKEFAKLTAKISNPFLSRQKLPYTVSDVMFIDVAQSLTQVQDKLGNYFIPNRAKLDTLFNILYTYTDTGTIIICDLYFDVPSDQDRALEVSMSRFPNLLSKVKTNSLQEITPNVINAGKSGTYGFSNPGEPFLIFSNTLFKFNLTDKNCIKTLPLLIYENIHHTGISCMGNMLHIGNEWFLNTVLINEALGLRVNKAVYEDQVIPLQKIINEEKTNIGSHRHALSKKKFIIIGNFKDDVHKTTFGEKPGPLIIFDLFISLQQKENRISIGWLLFALLFLSILIFKKFYHLAVLENYHKWLDKKSNIFGFKQAPDLDWFIFYLFVISSYIFFKVRIEPVAGIVLLYMLSWGRIYLRTRYKILLQLHRVGKRIGARTLFYYLFNKNSVKD